jgi:hypothetical protein
MLLMVILGAVALSITQLTNYIKALTIKKKIFGVFAF